MIKDKRGATPNYVVQGDRLVHQPTGRWVQLKDHSHPELRLARNTLARLIGAGS